jgi:molecular chaperone DnaJ
MASGQQNGPVQCHYDVLGCEQDADISVIKKKHRKLVLKYHPDKNLGDEQAADKFMLVQRAYEVLSGEFDAENAGTKPPFVFDENAFC